MNRVGIYQIRNKVNNKIYLGSSNNFTSRWWNHKKYLNNGTHINPKLQAAWRKHGEHNFIFEEVEQCANDGDVLLQREQFYLDTLKPHIYGYNICSIAGKPPVCKGRRFSLMHSKKVAQYTLDGVFVKVYESAKVASNSFCGLPAVSRAASRQIKTAGGFQWRYYNDTPLKQIESCLSAHEQNGVKHRKKVAQYTLDGSLVKKYDSAQHACRETGIDYTSISAIARGKWKSAGGYKWRFCE